MNQQIKVFANCCISYIVTFLIFVLTLLLSSRTSVFLVFLLFHFKSTFISSPKQSTAWNYAVE